MKTELTQSEKLQARLSALRSSQELNPNQRSSENMGTMVYQPITVAPSVDKVLQDADKIFNWLTA